MSIYIYVLATYYLDGKLTICYSNNSWIIITLFVLSLSLLSFLRFHVISDVSLMRFINQGCECLRSPPSRGANAYGSAR